MWVMKEKAKAEVAAKGEAWSPDMFNPQDVYYQIELDLRKQGIELPDESRMQLPTDNPNHLSQAEFKALLAQYQTNVAQVAYDQALSISRMSVEEIMAQQIHDWTIANPDASLDEQKEFGANLRQRAEEQVANLTTLMPPMPMVSRQRPSGQLITTTGADLAAAVRAPRDTAKETASSRFTDTLKQWFPEDADYLNQYFPSVYREFQSQTAKTGTKGGAEYPDPRYPGQYVSTMETVNIGEQDFMKWLSMKGKDFFGTLIPPKSPTRTTRVRFL